MADETTTRTRTYLQILEAEVARVGHLVGEEWTLLSKVKEGTRYLTVYRRTGPGRLVSISDEVSQGDFVLWLDGVKAGINFVRGGGK